MLDRDPVRLAMKGEGRVLTSLGLLLVLAVAPAARCLHREPAFPHPTGSTEIASGCLGEVIGLQTKRSKFNKLA